MREHNGAHGDRAWATGRSRLRVLGEEPRAQAGRERRDVSVVVPFKDEEGSLCELADRLVDVLRSEACSFEVVLIDDGSTDRSWDCALEASAGHEEVLAVRHRRNFGKATALGTGFAVASGGVVITMDADLQDDPVEIPRFLRLIDDGYQVVSGWKRVRHDPLGKRVPSKLFNAVARRGSGLDLHDFNCGFKAYTADVLRTLAPHLYGDMHRYLPVLAAAHGFTVGELEVRHHCRRFGESKYGVSRMLAGACDLLSVMLVTRFRHRPLHAFASLALILTAGAGGGAALMFALSGPDAIEVQMLLIGLIGAMGLVGCGLVCELVVLTAGPSRVEERISAAVRVGGSQARPLATEDLPSLASASLDPALVAGSGADGVR